MVTQGAHPDEWLNGGRLMRRHHGAQLLGSETAALYAVSRQSLCEGLPPSRLPRGGVALCGYSRRSTACGDDAALDVAVDVCRSEPDVAPDLYEGQGALGDGATHPPFRYGQPLRGGWDVEKGAAFGDLYR